MMDVRKIKKLIDLLEDSDVAEIEIKEGEDSVRISRISSSAPMQMMQAAPQQYAAPTVLPAAPPAAPPGSRSRAWSHGC